MKSLSDSVAHSANDYIWPAMRYSVWDSISMSIWDSVINSNRESASNLVENFMREKLLTTYTWYLVSDCIYLGARNAIWDFTRDPLDDFISAAVDDDVWDMWMAGRNTGEFSVFAILDNFIYEKFI